GLIGNKAYFDSLSTAQFTSSSPQNIPGFTYYNIVIANSNKTITNNCNVRGALNLLNNINTGTYTLTLGVSGSQPGVLNRNANGTISGRFKRWFAAATNTGSSGLFPMLVGTNYRPAVVEFTVAPTAAGTLTTEFFSIPPGNSGLYLYDFSLGFVEVNKAAVNGYWKIDPIGSSGGVYTLTLTGTGFYGISAVTDLRIIKRQTAGAWTLPSGSTAIAGTGSTSAPVVGRSGYSGFGEFTLGGDSTQNPMPVKWLSFDGILKEEGVLLNWKTVQEINNAYFIVERKTENKTDFESIAKEFPVKNGSIKSYAHLDQNNSKSEIYNYRIKQVDLDGKFSYSKTILIHSNYVSEEMIVGPNPAQDFIEVRNININEPIELIDALGKIISIKLENDKIRLNSIPSGIYLLNATSLNGERKSMRIIKE
ncbi:MAG: T9SS type A sorting domain-containing protein, partial [Bacteroidota bacterium]|nr:T9SS type A sorting domain-containing protein [Bacteroidota bacterium]